MNKVVPRDPYQIHDRYLGFWNNTESVKGIRSIGAIPPDIVEHIKPKLRSAIQVDSIWTPDAASQYLTQYPDITSLWLEEPTASMLITPEEIPVQFGLFDERVAFTVHDDATGYPHALVDTANPETLEWAHDLYAYYRDHAQPLETWIETSDQLKATVR